MGSLFTNDSSWSPAPEGGWRKGEGGMIRPQEERQGGERDRERERESAREGRSKRESENRAEEGVGGREADKTWKREMRWGARQRSRQRDGAVKKGETVRPRKDRAAAPAYQLFHETSALISINSNDKCGPLWQRLINSRRGETHQSKNSNHSMPRACTSVKRECVELHCVLKLLQFLACPEKVTDLMSVFGLRLTIFKKKIFFIYLGWALTFRKSLSLLRSNAAFSKYSIFIWHVWVGVIWLIRLTGLFTHTHTDTQTLSSSWFIAGNNGLEKIACTEVRAGCVAWKRWGKNKCSPLCSAHIFLLLLLPHSVGQCNTPSPISKKYRVCSQSL